MSAEAPDPDQKGELDEKTGDEEAERKSFTEPPSTHPWDREKRFEDRAAIQLRVDYKRLNTFFADYTKNISKGGTFIRTTKPLDVGTEFVFVLSVPSHNTQLELKGEVVWVVAEDKATPDNPAGMGIKFKFTGDDDRARVDDFVEKLMDEALGKHISNKLLRRS
jgi:type IV pilus assembly protein PilZ